MNMHAALSDPRPTWHNPRILFVLLMIFVGGVALGCFATHLYEAHATVHPNASWKGGGRAVTMAHLDRDLNLTPQQSEQIAMLLEDFGKYYDNLQGQMDDFRQDGRERIKKILTPEQQKKFDQIVSDMSTRIH